MSLSKYGFSNRSCNWTICYWLCSMQLCETVWKLVAGIFDLFPFCAIFCIRWASKSNIFMRKNTVVYTFLYNSVYGSYWQAAPTYIAELCSPVSESATGSCSGWPCSSTLQNNEIRPKMFCCFPSNTPEFTPIVCSWSITDTDSVLCASEH